MENKQYATVDQLRITVYDEGFCEDYWIRTDKGQYLGLITQYRADPTVYRVTVSGQETVKTARLSDALQQMLTLVTPVPSEYVKQRPYSHYDYDDAVAQEKVTANA